MSHGGSHFSHLSVATFSQGDFDPGGRNGLPKSDRNGAGWEEGFVFEQPYFGGLCSNPPDDDSVSEMVDRNGVRNVFDLDEVGSGMVKPRVCKPVFDVIVVSQKEQPFAVSVEPSNRIHIVGKWAEVSQ
jgi:hypothetical protein